jgi:hypothetical protein
MSALRIKNYVKQLGAKEEQVEQLIVRCTASHFLGLMAVANLESLRIMLLWNYEPLS